MSKKALSGAFTIGLLTGLIIGLAVGFVVYKKPQLSQTAQNQKSQQAQQEATTGQQLATANDYTTQQAAPDGWQNYMIPSLGFSMTMPKSWHWAGLADQKDQKTFIRFFSNEFIPEPYYGGNELFPAMLMILEQPLGEVLREHAAPQKTFTTTQGLSMSEVTEKSDLNEQDFVSYFIGNGNRTYVLQSQPDSPQLAIVKQMLNSIVLSSQ